MLLAGTVIVVAKPWRSPVEKMGAATGNGPASVAAPTPSAPEVLLLDKRPVPSPQTPPQPSTPVVAKVLDAKIPPPKPASRIVVKRMSERTPGDVLKQVAKAPSLTLDRTKARAESAEVVRAAFQATANADPTVALLDHRADLAGLPLRRGTACRLPAASAQHLAKTADQLKSLTGDALTATLGREKVWREADRVPALMQVLMIQADASRESLALHLGAVEGTVALAGLVKIALYDPHPDVRRQAIESLAKRPDAEYRPLLLRGFESPWPVVAEHAAEALAALAQTEAIPALMGLLNGPDPRAPYAKGTGPTLFVKELVRVNHKFNCLLCHPASFRETDPARALVPTLAEQQEKGTGGGYGGFGISNKRTFIRADITYLVQDYSVMLRVVHSRVLSGEERYDLFVRERLATGADLKATAARQRAGLTAHEQAAMFALRELTGLEPGPNLANWLQFARR